MLKPAERGELQNLQTGTGHVVIQHLLSLDGPLSLYVGKSTSWTQQIATRMLSTGPVHLTTSANVEEFAGKHRNSITLTFLSVLLYTPIHTNMAHSTNILTSNAVQDRFTVEHRVP